MSEHEGRNPLYNPNILHVELQRTFVAEEQCLAGPPCRSNECAACVYTGDAP